MDVLISAQDRPWIKLPLLVAMSPSHTLGSDMHEYQPGL